VVPRVVRRAGLLEGVLEAKGAARAATAKERVKVTGKANQEVKD
jgi:hypothetical protein